MEPQQDKWINDILGSINNIERAEPNPFLFAKIQNRLTTISSTIYVPSQTVWLAVTSFALLLLLNWRIISHHSGPADSSDAELNTVVSEMQLYPASNQPYDLWSGQNY